MASQVRYRPDSNGMRELMVGRQVRQIVDDATDRGYQYMQGASGYEQITKESFVMTVFGDPRACGALYNPTPGGIAADARTGLFSQVVGVIESGGW
ncbi:MAG TPA: hypothetical protein VK053_19280 [Jiangellaceae bacterium]|nr:hypothetical protein [Jiangellaceae bacterium]